MSKKVATLLVLFAALVFLGLIYFSLQSIPKANYTKFTLNQTQYNITYVASNESALEHGLMNTTVTNSTTMLFVFQAPGIYPFWMFDTYTNLDMIWINASGGQGRIVYIIENATSCFNASNCAVYTPNANANYVIEARSGFVNRNSVYLGEKIALN